MQYVGTAGRPEPRIPRKIGRRRAQPRRRGERELDDFRTEVPPQPVDVARGACARLL